MSRAVAALVLLPLFLPPAARAVETVRIAMGEERGRVQLCGEGLSIGEDVEEGAFTPLDRSCAVVRQAGGHLVLDGTSQPGGTVRFRAGLPAGEAEDAGAPGQGSIRVRGSKLEVRGDVVVKQARGGRLVLINVLPLEDYIAAVLGGEMPVTFPDEALKAQAVAARTYALRKKLEAYSADAHLGSSVLHQVYGGLHREDARTRAAVEATRGEVLTYDLEPIEAYFHASCGGRTEAGLAALGRDLPYLEPVDCPCGELAASHWSLTLSLSELGEAVGVHDVRTLAVLARTETGRARLVRLGPEQTLDAVSLRKRLGYSRFKSLNFEVEQTGGKELRINGRGYGHGAGLCQWGARQFADAGWDYQQILAHYYPGTELQVLY